MKRKSLEEAQSYAMSFFDKLLNDKRYALEQRESTKELIESAVKCGYIFAGNEKMYSEEEVKFIISEALQSSLVMVNLDGWFEQFKKK